MHGIDRGQRVALRAKLLLGVAGATAAASTAALADQPTASPTTTDKWVPYVDIGGGVGTGMTAGKSDAFVPIWQNLDSMLFVSLGIGTETKANQFENFGAGYRTKINSEWILGGYVGFDSTQLKDTNTFNQTSFGVEAMSADWDARINAYIASNELKGAGPDGGHMLYINGTTIAVLDSAEAGYTGFDGEVGYRVFSTDDTDVRVFIGGFHFGHVDSNSASLGQTFTFGYRGITGPKARAEATVYDLDVLGNQSRFTLGGEIAHDDVRGTTGFIGATLRIPLGDIGGGAQALDELDRRMTDPERRNDTVLTRGQFDKPEPVIIYGAHVTSQPTNTLLYVSSTTTPGVGTYANPTTLADATSRHTTNAFIVLSSKGAPIPGGATLQPGQTLVAGGEIFTVEGELSHATFTHLFDPSTNVTLIPAAPGGTVLTVANNTSLYGFTIEGNFGDAIYGKNVDHVNISGITIDGTGGGHTGIDIRHTVSGAENITIQNVAISNLTEDGIDLASNISDGGTSTETFKLSNIAVTNAYEGINVSDYATNGSQITSSVTISNATISNVGYTGISISAGAYGVGSSTNQTVAVSNATVTNTGGEGINVGLYAGNGAHVTGNASFSNVTVSGAYYSDFSGYARAHGAGSAINQTLSISNATFTGAGYTGVAISASADAGTSVDQTVSLNDVTVTNSGASGFYGRGIALYASAYGTGATVHQTATITNANVSYITGSFVGEGFFVDAEARAGGAVVQSVSIDPSSATHNGIGLYVKAYAEDYGLGQTTVDQMVSVSGTAASPASFSNNTDDGVIVVGYAGVGGPIIGYSSQAAISQSVTISNAVIDHNFFGVTAEAAAADGASVTQNLYLANADIGHNTRYGVRIGSYARFLGFAAQNVTITGSPSSYSNISYNGSDGVFIRADAYRAGLVQQNVSVYYAHIDHNGGDGVRVENVADGYLYGSATHTVFYSHISQNLIFGPGTISSNAGNGFEIQNSVQYGAQIDQLVELYGEKIDHNGGYGFIENSVVTTYAGYGFSLPTNLHSDVYIYNSDVSNNAKSGIEIDAALYSPTYNAVTIGFSYLEQHITVANTTVNGNTKGGFVANAYDAGVYGDNIQYITLANSTFSHNGVDGAYFGAIQHYGPGSFGDAIQEVTVSGSTFNNNARDGLYAYAEAYGQQGRAEQHFTISNSSFDTNGRNGASFVAYAHDGVYLTGYGCGKVQGLPGGCAFVRQTVSISGSDASYNTYDGVYTHAHANNYGAVYNSSGRPVYTPTMLIENSTLDANGEDGLHVTTYATHNSYVYSYAVAVNSHFDGNAANGIHVVGDARTGSAVVQRAVLYGTGAAGASTADYNGNDGVFVNAYARGGAVNQVVGVYNSDVSYNGGNGVFVNATTGPATGGTASGYVVNPNVSAISQYAHVNGSTVLGNAGYGVKLRSHATGASSAIYQYLGVVGSTISGNMSDGVYAFAIAYSGASVNQSLYFANDTIQNNIGDGVYAAEVAVNQSSATQTVNFGYLTGYTTTITGNHGDGIYIGASAFSGSNAVQTAFVYDVNSSYNHRNGLSLGLNASGYGFGASYIYYSHVSQNLVAAYASFDHNGTNGVAVSNVSYYGGAANQSLQLISIDASHNTGDGFHETTALTSFRGSSFAFSTNITTDLYLIGSTFNQNTGNGVSIAAHNNGPVYAPAFFGGYSYLIQHTTITGITADKNGGDGLVLDGHQSGRYGLNAQYVTVSGSEFNHNTGSGAKFLSVSYYGPAGFGDTYENINIGTSKFSYNGANGLEFDANASGRQGRAEQHVTVTGSYAEHNTGDGVHIYASAINGTYIAGHPCNTAQGLPGGCAFVRQSIVIKGTNISYNTGNGVFVGTYANHYGAIYGKSGRPHAPTLELYGDTINNNGAHGVDVSNHTSGHSYLYQYIAMIDTHLDHNHSDGLYASSYVGGASTMLQRALLYSFHTGASASYNGGSGVDGFKSTIEALVVYARDTNIVEGVDLSHNGLFAFDGAVAYADGTSTGLQINDVYLNTINHNGDGIGLYSIGSGAQQVNYIGSPHFAGGNTVAYNAFVGVYGEANFGAHQKVYVYAYGNNVHDNGTNYLFNSFGGSTQILH